MKNVLFVCVENSCRSQMAEAFGNMYGQNVIKAFSCGSRPSGRVNPRAVSAMQAIGYNLAMHYSKGLEDIPEIDYDVLVTMGCGDVCPAVHAHTREDWAIPDPRDMDPEDFASVRDMLAEQVKLLLARYRD